MANLLYVIPANSSKEDIVKSLQEHPEIKFVSLVGIDMAGNDPSTGAKVTAPFSVDDLSGRTTANTASSTYAAIAEGYGATVTPVDSLTETIMLVEQGRVDATINAKGSIDDYLAEHPDANIRVAQVLPQGEPVAYPVRKGEDTQTLVAAIDEILEAARQDGTLAAIVEKYIPAE